MSKYEHTQFSNILTNIDCRQNDFHSGYIKSEEENFHLSIIDHSCRFHYHNQMQPIFMDTKVIMHGDTVIHFILVFEFHY